MSESTQINFNHRPVMEQEIADMASSLPPGLFLDATLGGAGHAQAILTNCSDLSLVGIDQDPMALTAAKLKLEEFGERVNVVRGNFYDLKELISKGDDKVVLSGFLFDLGVSSPQLDLPERGFSYNHDAPLDMRMDPDSSLSARNVVNEYDVTELQRAIYTNSDEKFANRIAKAIVAARPISGTAELADVIVTAIPAPARRKGGHPAKRTFQAIRIEVNGELRILEPALQAALKMLTVGGTGMVLTYHSGEDKITKSTFRECSTSLDPPGLPKVVSVPKFARPKVKKPSQIEIDTNRRASSARLRTIQRLVA